MLTPEVRKCQLCFAERTSHGKQPACVEECPRNVMKFGRRKDLIERFRTWSYEIRNVAVSVPALSDKDREDLRFAMRLGVDLIALSFVRSPDDIKLVHQIMAEDSGQTVMAPLFDGLGAPTLALEDLSCQVPRHRLQVFEPRRLSHSAYDDVDDLARAGLFHVRVGGLRSDEGAGEVGVDCVAPSG